MTDQALPPLPAASADRWWRRFLRLGPKLAVWARAACSARLGWWWLAPPAVLAILLYYGIGAWVTSVIDCDPGFSPGGVSARQSRAVAVTGALIRREVDTHSWTPNDPVFLPGALLRDMPRFQTGIIAALGRFVATLDERQSLAGVGSPDLSQAAGLLKYPPTVWRFELSKSWAPTTAAEKQYRQAAAALVGYNRRIDEGALDFDHGAEALAAILTDMARDLGQASAAGEDFLAEGHWAFSGAGEGLFFENKGRLYAYSIILRELGVDDIDTLAGRGVGPGWRQLLQTMRRAAGLSPWMVINGAPDSGMLPSHLAAQGFYLLRARQEMGDLAEALTAK